MPVYQLWHYHLASLVIPENLLYWLRERQEYRDLLLQVLEIVVFLKLDLEHLCSIPGRNFCYCLETQFEEVGVKMIADFQAEIVDDHY